MQVDIARIVDMIPFLPYVFSCFTSLVVAVAILIPITGASSSLGLGTMTVLMIINFFLAKCANNYNEKMMDYKDERMKYTTELFTHIKMLKIYGWEQALLKRVEAIRAKEMHCLWMYMFTYCFLIFSLWSSPVAAAFAIFSSYTYLFNHEVTVAMAFSTLSVLMLLQSPLRELPSCLSWILQAWVSSKRIDEFMKTEDVQDSRTAGKEIGNVSFTEASFAYSEKGEPVLKDISLNIAPGEFVAIVGKVGSGKSSMVNALLGELKQKSGSLSVNGALAYTAALESWIQNATVRDNILFGKSYEPDKYQATLQSSALLSDLAILPGSDMTEIGEKGINLSGGQKARVALARAVYQDCDIYLLDDPLSSVDAHVGAHIFHQCFLGALKGKTRILVTHNTNFLNLVDRVIVMENGSISEMGPLSELKVNLQVLNSSSSSESSKETAAFESKTDVKLMDTEDREVGKVSMSVYMTYFRYAGGLCFLLTAASSMFLWVTFRFLSDYTLKNWSESNGSQSNLSFLIPYIVLGTIACLFIFVRALVISLAGVKAASAIHASMLHRLIRAPINLFYDVTPLGRILNRLSKDTNDIDGDIAFAIGGALVIGFSVLGSMCTTVFYLPWVIAVVPLVLLAGLWVQKRYLSMSRETSRLIRIYKSPILNHFTESLNGLKTIRCFKRQFEFQDKNIRAVEVHNKVLFSNFGCEMWLNIRMDGLAVAYFCTAALVMLWSRDNLSTGSAGMMLAYLLPLSDLLTAIMKDFARVENSMVCVERAHSMSE
jgi:ABC-type multidrug transport system fused ATPase/permease subunit